jgi:signal transduction histidine kinase
VSRNNIAALCCGAGLVLAFAVAPFVVHSDAFRVAMGDVVPLMAIAATFIISARNACDSKGHTRLFWSLMTAGMAMWCFNQAGWAWYEVLLHRALPDPFIGDIVLFLHVVPIMAAVAIRPHQADTREGMLPSALNVLILLVWWVVIYAFVVLPQEYIYIDIAAYTPRFDLLYFLEGVILIAVSASAYFTTAGAWRAVYRNLFCASVLYTLTSEAINAAILRGKYHTGGLYDVPLLIATMWFLWAAFSGRRCLADTQTGPESTHSGYPFVPLLAKLALLSLPVMAYWAQFLNDEPVRLRHVRFAAALGGVGVLAFVVLLRQHLLDRRVLQLLKHSRRSFDNLQRLQKRVIQQAKLASLGELVALAAGELEYPLTSILASSERMAASSNLTKEQLGVAQKIGQQARRTRELVSDLLSFAQQMPGEKVPLDLKPILQRAVQMEGFKLDNKRITLTVESQDLLPRVHGNLNQLLQAFLQIVENAVDALQEVGGGKLQVSLWREKSDVVIQFADDGPGMRDPERVFDPFYTTKPIGKGTGLGLSATYGVIQDHKGQITCYNRPEGGAAFEIRLPALRMGAALAEGARA